MSEPMFKTLGGIQDHGFDAELVSDSFPDWTFSGSASFIRETYLQYDGDSYTIISADSNGDHFFYQDLAAANLTVGKTYFLSFRYKILDNDLTTGTGGGVRVQLAVRGGDDDGKIYAATKCMTTKTGENWKSLKVGFTARDSASRLSVGMFGAYGKLAIDDVRINVMEDASGATLNNPSFEPLGDLGPAPYGWTGVRGGGSISTVTGGTTGRASVQLGRTTTGVTTLSQSISFPSAQKTPYEGYVYYKLDTVGAAGANLRIYQTIQGGAQDLFVSDTLTGSGEWTQLPFAFKTVPDESNTYLLTVELKLADSGAVEFDGLMLRRKPILACDFKDDWAAHWTVVGDGIVDNTGYKLNISNGYPHNNTTVSQNIHVYEGLPCMIGGRIQANATVAADEVGGAYISVYDLDKDEMVEELGPFTSETEWKWWSINVACDEVGTPSAQRFKVKLELRNCSGTFKLGDLNDIVVPIPDLVTVVPQPTTPPSGTGEERLIYPPPLPLAKLFIVYDTSDTEMHDIYLELHTDLTGADGIPEPDIINKPNPYSHYFAMSPFLIQPRDILAFNPATEKPAIVIGLESPAIVDVPPPVLAKIEQLMADYKIIKNEVAVQGSEGYVVNVPSESNPVVMVLSIDHAGVYYGTQTLLQMLTENRVVTPTATIYTHTLPAYRILDKPDKPVRAVFMDEGGEYSVDPKLWVSTPEGPDPKTQYNLDLFKKRSDLNSGCGDDRSPLEAYAKFMSRLKINMLIIQNPMFYCLSSDSTISGKTNGEILEEFFKYCRKNYITPVPGMQSFTICNQLLQFEHNMVINGIERNFKLWKQVEARYSGGDPKKNATKETRAYECFPMPMPAEEIEIISLGQEHVLHTRFALNESFFYDLPQSSSYNGYCYGISVEQLLKNEKGELYWDEIEQGLTTYTVEEKPLQYNALYGYSSESWDDDVPNRNIRLVFHIDPHGNKLLFRARYHSVPPDRLYLPADTIDLEHLPETPSYKRVSMSYCPRSLVIQDFMNVKIGEVVDLFKPSYIYFGHEEPALMHACGRCFPEEYDENDPRYTQAGHTMSPNGILFGENVDHLINFYHAHCAEAGIPAGKIIMQADHICGEHESCKVPDPGPLWEQDLYPMAWERWWDYRGQRYNWTLEHDHYRFYNPPEGPGENGWVNTCKWKMIQDGHLPHILLLDWRYYTDELRVSADGNSDVWKSLPDWFKYKYIQELTGAGFDTIGGSNGVPRGFNKDIAPGQLYPLPDTGDSAPAGAMVYVKLSGTQLGDTGARNDTWERFFKFECVMEGSFDSDIKLMSHTPARGDSPECVKDANGLWWFSRYYENLNLSDTDLDADREPWVTKATLYIDNYGVGTSGEFWVDDVELSVNIVGNTWFTIIGMEGINPRNYSFETPGGTGSTFSDWDDPDWNGSAVQGLTISSDQNIYHARSEYPVSNHKSCYHKSINRRSATGPAGRLPKSILPIAICDPDSGVWSSPFKPLLQLEVPVPDEYNIFALHRYHLQAFFRTHYVDTGRMIQAREWRISGGNNNPHYKGGAYQNWAERCLPFDDTTNFKWKLKAALVGTAAWNWNYRYPRTAYLSDMNFDPFVMLRKEVPWAKKV